MRSRHKQLTQYESTWKLSMALQDMQSIRLSQLPLKTKTIPFPLENTREQQVSHKSNDIF